MQFLGSSAAGQQSVTCMVAALTVVVIWATGSTAATRFASAARPVIPTIVSCAYHGWADQAIPPFSSVDYYRAVVMQMGGFASAQSFSRLYMIPGLYHCPCGQPVDGDPATTVQFMPQLTDWVENGRAPAAGWSRWLRLLPTLSWIICSECSLGTTGSLSICR